MKKKNYLDILNLFWAITNISIAVTSLFYKEITIWLSIVCFGVGIFNIWCYKLD